METNNMLNKQIEKYLSSASGLPFFYSVSESEYVETISQLNQAGVESVYISDFCKNGDRNPRISDIIDFFRTADVDYKTNKYVLLGLGDYLALHGNEEAISTLREFKNKTLGNARVILLLKYVDIQIKELISEDIRLRERVLFGNMEDSHTSIMIIPYDMSSTAFTVYNGMKSLLKGMASGDSGSLYVKTVMQWENSILPVITIKDSYSLIRRIFPLFEIAQDYGTEWQWNQLLKELQKNDLSFEKVFSRHNFTIDDVSSDIEKAFGYEYNNWLYFIFLKINEKKIGSQYLRYVLNNTNKYELFKEKLLTAIIAIPVDSPLFGLYYKERKAIVKRLDEADISLFVSENAIDPSNGICRLTDNTTIEKQAIISWISNNGIVPELEQVYPALFHYLENYTFDCGAYSSVLTKYFSEYKRQKVLNRLSDGFEEKAHEQSLLYAHLDTRENIISKIEDKGSCLLVWIDALGVEYLSIIQWIAKDKGLSLNTHIARADLPTITSVNKGFFDSWEYDKIKISELDDIKHKEKGGFDNIKCSLPIHLANELDVIQKEVKDVAARLLNHKYKKIIIASDHGASRLAVLSQHEEKYYTDTKGEHSGRCCKYFDDYDIDNSIAENGYIILTDYGRFKGSRAANVEVHGGATLEETVVPLIELTLKSGFDTEVRLINSDDIKVDRKNGVAIQLYISDIKNSGNLGLTIKGKRYSPNTVIDEHHYMFILSDIKRSGRYNADVYDGQDVIGKIVINVKGAVGSSNSDFDDLF